MFIVSCLEDDVRVAPQDLGLPTEEAILGELEKSFIDKVIKDLGLVITIYDIVSISEGNVYHSEGAAHYKVTFNAVVFRPSLGQTLLGKVIDMDEKGMTVGVTFFKDIHIPSDFLPSPHKWDPETREWAWQAEDAGDFYYTRGHEIIFKVHAVRFKHMPTLQDQQQQKEAKKLVDGSQEKPFVPMQVIGKADGDGLGMIHWYKQE